MYICLDCGATFDEPSRFAESHGMEGPYREFFSLCPCCGEPGFEEATFCDECDAMIPVSYTTDRFGLCETCETTAFNRFEEFMETFTPGERKYINWLFDGKEF
jgi:hypothetical protein